VIRSSTLRILTATTHNTLWRKSAVGFSWCASKSVGTEIGCSKLLPVLHVIEAISYKWVSFVMAVWTCKSKGSSIFSYELTVLHALWALYCVWWLWSNSLWVQDSLPRVSTVVIWCGQAIIPDVEEGIVCAQYTLLRSRCS
jgi:hypothetical protein